MTLNFGPLWCVFTSIVLRPTKKYPLGVRPQTVEFAAMHAKSRSVISELFKVRNLAFSDDPKTGLACLVANFAGLEPRGDTVSHGVVAGVGGQGSVTGIFFVALLCRIRFFGAKYLLATS